MIEKKESNHKKKKLKVGFSKWDVISMAIVMIAVILILLRNTFKI